MSKSSPNTKSTTLRLPAKPLKAAASKTAPKKSPSGAKRAAPTTHQAAAPAARKAKPPTKPAGDEGERLAKRVAQMVPCSRSEAERYIAGGWVRVDGQVVEEPQARVQQQQEIELASDGSTQELSPVTLLLHKPVDWVDGSEESLAKLNRAARRAGFDDARTLLTAQKHQANDPAQTRVLQRHFKQLHCVVPLENAASGLVVYTQDWRIQRKLTEDMGSMEHELIVDIRGEVTPQALQQLNQALASGEHMPQTKISISSTTPERSKLRFAVKGAHRGLIAHLCAQAGLEILDMRRIRLGRVALSDLPVGQWRYLGLHERF